MEKFINLSNYFKSQNSTSFTLTFDEIEKIIGHSDLHLSNKNRAYFANVERNPIAKSWLNNGYRLLHIDKRKGTLTFEKILISTKSLISSSIMYEMINNKLDVIKGASISSTAVVELCYLYNINDCVLSKFLIDNNITILNNDGKVISFYDIFASANSQSKQLIDKNFDGFIKDILFNILLNSRLNNLQIKKLLFKMNYYSEIPTMFVTSANAKDEEASFQCSLNLFVEWLSENGIVFDDMIKNVSQHLTLFITGTTIIEDAYLKYNMKQFLRYLLGEIQYPTSSFMFELMDIKLLLKVNNFIYYTNKLIGANFLISDIQSRIIVKNNN